MHFDVLPNIINTNSNWLCLAKDQSSIALTVLGTYLFSQWIWMIWMMKLWKMSEEKETCILNKMFEWIDIMMV